MKSTTVRYLEPGQVRVFHSRQALHPRVEILDEQTILAALFKKAFPLSSPRDYISIQGSDGTEIGILKSLDGLDPESSEIVLRDLDRRYFTHLIQRILQLRMEAGMWRFEVDTQRGPTEFFVRNLRDSAH